MFKQLKKHFCWSLALSAVTLSLTSGSPIKLEKREEEIPYGITLRDTKEKFTIFQDGSDASDIVQSEDGSITWVATSKGGAGGGVSLYVKSTKEEINIANYESLDLEFDFTPVEGKWSTEAQDPGFCLRVLPWDSTGIFGGYEDLDCFEGGSFSGSVTTNLKIPSDFADRIIKSSDFDSVLGIALKFNDYLRGNETGDQLKVTLKNVKFHPKQGAPEDKAFDDGLKDSERGTVVEINYPTRDYTVDESALTDSDRYKKHAWVYLPSGYDASDEGTTYPLFILLHGGGQNENSWGLTNKGRGGKIKGFMDRGMASGEVKKFILIAANGVASKNWGPNGAGSDRQGYDSFEGELRNDIIPYMKANYHIKEGRDNIAMAGLSMGGIQSFNIGIAKCLDIISHFAGFSGAVLTPTEQFMASVDGNKDNEGLMIHNLYITYGDQDILAKDTFPGLIESIKDWDRIENFKSYVFPDGTHDFPVWYKGFNDFIHMAFKIKGSEEPGSSEEPTDLYIVSDTEDSEESYEESDF